MKQERKNPVRHDRPNVTTWYSIIGFTGLMLIFIVAFVIPLRYRIATFHTWQTGDWLIDYSAGFVRRGFFGALLGPLNLDGVQLIGAVALVQFALAGALFAAVGFLYWRSPRTPAWIMLVLSPAFMLFPLLDPDASARKELLGLITLAIVAVATSLSRTTLGALIAIPVFAVAAFSHELNIVLIPAILYLLFTQGPDPRRTRIYIIAAGYALIAMTAGASALISSGDERIVANLCANWLNRGIPNCDGALAALSQPPREAQDILFTEFFPGYWAYLIPASLALVPLFAVRFLPKHWIAAILIVAAASPLFLIAWDYGRWIFLITAQLSLIALAINQREKLVAFRVPVFAALAFILLWGVDHVGQPITPGLLLRLFG